MDKNVKQVENIINFLKENKKVLTTEEILNISSACIGAAKRLKNNM